MKTVALVLVALLLLPSRADAYLEFTITVGGQSTAFKWKASPVRWFATDRGVPGVSASQFQAAIASAFATWQAVPTASISFQFAGFTGAEPFDDDNMPVLGFQSEPELERVLGATGFVIDTLTGEIVESDVFFNSAFAWSTGPGDPTRFDLQSVATHEIGHFIGLGHSALGETEVRPEGGRRVIATGAVMFPISFGRGITLDRQLQPDDIAGVSDLYPDDSFRTDTGVVRGRVVKNGSGVLGAHVVAFNPATGRMIGGFTLNRDGEFQIAGLDPGPHVIRVEPLDDGDIESFFGGLEPIDLNFQPAFYQRLFVAPPGGVGERVTVTVRPK
jgi:hypothetical protein